MNGLIDVIQKRWNVTEFKSDSINEEDIENILEAARWAPSAGNGQPWELIVIKNLHTKKEIAKIHASAMSGSKKAEELPASYLNPPVLIAICVDIRIKDKYPDVFSKEFLIYASIGALIENIWLAATSLGLGMGMGSQPLSAQDELKDLLGLVKYLWIPEVLQIGYPAKERTETERRELREFVHREKIDRKKLRTGL